MKIAGKRTQTNSTKKTNSPEKVRKKRARKPAGIVHGRARFESRRDLDTYLESVADAFLDANPYGAN